MMRYAWNPSYSLCYMHFFGDHLPVNISADVISMPLLRSWAAIVIASQACNLQSCMRLKLA